MGYSLTLRLISLVILIPFRSMSQKLPDNLDKGTLLNAERPVQREIQKLLKQKEVELIFSCGFETGLLSEAGVCSGNCPVIVMDESDSTFFMRAELSNNDPRNDFRTEISLGENSEFEIGKGTYLVYFRMRPFPDDATGFPDAICMQLHTRTKKEKEPISPWLPLVGRLRSDASGGIWQSYSSGRTTMRRKFLSEPGEWRECLLVIRLASNEKGRLQVIGRNGIEFDHQGLNCSDSWTQPLFLKLGIYAARNKRLTNVPVSKRTTDFDDIMILRDRMTMSDPFAHFSIFGANGR